MTGVLIKREIWTQRCTGNEDNVERHGEKIATQDLRSEAWSSHRRQTEPGLLSPWTWTPSLQNYETTHFYCLSHPICKWFVGMEVLSKPTHTLRAQTGLRSVPFVTRGGLCLACELAGEDDHGQYRAGQLFSISGGLCAASLTSSLTGVQKRHQDASKLTLFSPKREAGGGLWLWSFSTWIAPPLRIHFKYRDSFLEDRWNERF